MNPDEAAAEWLSAIMMADATTDRSAQQALGVLGVSDVGTCRERARRMVTGMPHTDAPTGLAAWIGTQLHRPALEARKQLAPELLHEVELSIGLPGGYTVVGHADEIDPSEPSVTDLKTVDGLGAIVSSEQQRFQRHLYAHGAIQAGLVPAEGLLVRNVWLDRSGRYKRLHVEQEPFDPNMVEMASQWLEDVEYAARRNEEASKDRPSSWCAACCPFFTGCRGGQSVQGEVVADPQYAELAGLYRRASDEAKEASLVAEDARRALEDVEGRCGDWLVSWTTVNAQRGAYRKINVRKVAA